MDSHASSRIGGPGAAYLAAGVARGAWCGGGAAAGADHDARIKVYSIQWLCRHYGEMGEQPGLMVIDEAHHALAATYAEVMNACHGAKKLGLTATPCRLNCRGFGQLFEVLLQSWSYNKFIANGRLSLYDYMSVRPDSEEQKVVCGLKNVPQTAISR